MKQVQLTVILVVNVPDEIDATGFALSLKEAGIIDTKNKNQPVADAHIGTYETLSVDPVEPGTDGTGPL